MANHFHSHIGHGYNSIYDKTTQPIFVENYKPLKTIEEKTRSPKNLPPLLFPEICSIDFERTTQSNSVILTSTEELKHHFALNYGVSFCKGMFSKSERLSKYVENTYLALSKARFSWVTLLLRKDIVTLNSQVIEAIAQLPATYDQAKYSNFITTYGTHYIVRAEYGGLAELRVITEQNKNSTVDPKVLLDYSIQLLAYILTAEGECPSKPVFNWQTDMQYEGGDISFMLGKTDITKWQATFASNPALVNMYAEDIFTLPSLNETQKANLKKSN